MFAYVDIRLVEGVISSAHLEDSDLPLTIQMLGLQFE